MNSFWDTYSNFDFGHPVIKIAFLRNWHNSKKFFFAQSFRYRWELWLDLNRRKKWITNRFCGNCFLSPKQVNKAFLFSVVVKNKVSKSVHLARISVSEPIFMSWKGNSQDFPMQVKQDSLSLLLQCSTGFWRASIFSHQSYWFYSTKHLSSSQT